MKLCTEEARDDWVRTLEAARDAAIQEKNAQEDPGIVVKLQIKTREIYQGNVCQYVIGLVIFSSYITSIVNSQFPERGQEAERGLAALEVLYTVIFTVELAANLFGSWLAPFFRDGWNVFDLMVVITSLISIFAPTFPAVNVLRLVRVFKMVRLFRQLTSLRM